MAENDSIKTKLTESDLEQIGRDIGDVASTILKIRNLATHIGHGIDDDVDTIGAGLAGIVALSEKAGFISDRCAEALGDVAVCGSLEAWARLERPQPGANHG